MPIASFADYSEAHWRAVEVILAEALSEVGFDAKLVSQESASGVIHQRIITNLYSNEIVVCDVSARNPNVMFELGMRLAFDRPTVIVKDEETPFSFDISAIEHVPYTRSLSYLDIKDFKKRLGEKVKSTSSAAREDPNYSTFLKHIGGLTPGRLNLREVPFEEYISSRLDEIGSQLSGLLRRNRLGPGIQSPERDTIYVDLIKTSWIIANQLMEKIDEDFGAPMIALHLTDEDKSVQTLRVLATSGAMIDSKKIIDLANSMGIPSENIRFRKS